MNADQKSMAGGRLHDRSASDGCRIAMMDLYYYPTLFLNRYLIDGGATQERERESPPEGATLSLTNGPD
jgi:hypothetical protein